MIVTITEQQAADFIGKTPVPVLIALIMAFALWALANWFAAFISVITLFETNFGLFYAAKNWHRANWLGKIILVIYTVLFLPYSVLSVVALLLKKVISLVENYCFHEDEKTNKNTYILGKPGKNQKGKRRK